MAAYMREEWWNSTFLNGKFLERKSQSRNSKLQAVLKIFCDFGEGAQSMCPLAWIGLRMCTRSGSVRARAHDHSHYVFFAVAVYLRDVTCANVFFAVVCRMLTSGLFFLSCSNRNGYLAFFVMPSILFCTCSTENSTPQDSFKQTSFNFFVVISNFSPLVRIWP